MKVYAVARQSRGDDNSKSVAEQEARIRDWCEREGHELRGGAGGDTKAAEAEVARVERALSATVEAFDGFADVAAVREKMADLRAELDEAQDALDRARRSASFTLTTAGESWDELTVGERRDLIRAAVERADVEPGRGAERIRITLAPELAEAQRVLDGAAGSFRDDLDG